MSRSTHIERYSNATESNTSVTVGVASTQILAANNPARISASITNLGTVPVFIAFGAAAVLNQGRVIPANGGIVEIEADGIEGADNWLKQTINGIVASGTADVAISEVSR